MQHLREFGVQITGHPSTGYQLESVPDLLLPEILGPLVSGTIFASHIHHYFRIGSTNYRDASGGAASPKAPSLWPKSRRRAAAAADTRWESAQSAGIYCSVVLRPPLSPADALLLSLIAGIAVAEAVEQTTGLHPDLALAQRCCCSNGRKFCGILTEMNAEADTGALRRRRHRDQRKPGGVLRRTGADRHLAADGERTRVVAASS